MVKLKIINFSQTPKIYTNKNFVFYPDWYNEENIWGAWRYPNKKTKHTRKCFDIEYSSNEIGARDSSFKNTTYKKNIFLLGDSMAEGYGVSYNKRFEYNLEKKFNSNILNFSSSFDLGPVQYYLIYKNFYQNYDHDTLIISFFPQNDFTDNDYSETKWKNNKRWRPYYKKHLNDYHIFIPDNAIKNSLIQSTIKKILTENFYLSNTIRSLKLEILKRFSKTNNYSGYYDSSIEQQKASIFFIRKILKLAKDKKIILISIPSVSDINKKNNTNKNNIYWTKKFKNLQTKNSNFKFLNLINFLPPDTNSLYLECDGHLSEEGNKWISEILSRHLK